MNTSWDGHNPKRAAVKREANRGMDDGWTVTGTLIAGIAFWGFVGWLASRWTGWVGWFPMGVVLGAVAGVYLVYKQAASPPPLLDISRSQDGGLAARHARRLQEQEQQQAAEGGEQTGHDEGHNPTGR